MKARLLLDARCILAEGIQWRTDQQRLWWTDIHGRALWSCDADGGDARKLETPERLGSFAFDPNGHILAAFESGLFKWDPEGDRLERISDFEPEHATNRLNDGRCDRRGRFVTGGVDEDGLKPTSSVIRYDGMSIETLRHNVGCANSICFSPDGAFLYFADTPSGIVERIFYESTEEEFGRREDFINTAETNEGFPDGSCIDANGAIWNARFNGFSVRQFHRDGSEGITVHLPVPQVTCACFGGPDLDRLFITTGRENMSDAEIGQYPHSGGIFVARPGVNGLAEDRFATDLFP